MFMIKKRLLNFILATVSMTASAYLFASGMQPSTSVVLINEEQGEYGMTVKNTDKTAALLYTSLQNIEEDPEKLLIVTPPVARVEAGESQLVRFILQNKQPLTTQRLMRVYFEGIPQNTDKKPNSLGVTVRQNLPVIISPANLATEREPWKHLKLSLCGSKLRVQNNSPYVVRLAQTGTLQPSGTPFQLPKPYILPNTTLDIPVKAASGSTARIHPATVYGFAVGKYDTPLSACSN
jgi:P pilus assembly chaperone PapD